jgi:fibronectin-binding autotransporter adhesin
MPPTTARLRSVPPTILSGPLYPAVNVRRAGLITPTVALLAGMALLGGGHAAKAQTADTFSYNFGTTTAGASMSGSANVTVTGTYAVGEEIKFTGTTSTTNPFGTTATTYYVVAVNATNGTVEVSTTPGGTAISATNTTTASTAYQYPDWQVSGNWSSGVANSNSTIATFGNAPANMQGVTISGSNTVYGLTYNPISGNSDLDFDGGANGTSVGTLTFATNDSSVPIITMSGNGTTHVINFGQTEAINISGSQGLDFRSGLGTVTGTGLTATATEPTKQIRLTNITWTTFSGGYTIDRGAVQLVNPNELSQTQDLTVGNSYSATNSDLAELILDSGGSAKNQTIGNLNGNAWGRIAGLTASGSTSTLTVGNNNATGGNFGGIIGESISGVSSPVNLTKTGTGTQTISGLITSTGGVTVSAGTLVLSGNNTESGATSVTGTLQAVATSGNTTSGSSTALSASSALTLNTGSTLQLRADANTTFTPLSITVAAAATLNFDVNDVTSGMTNNTLTLSGALAYTGGATDQINVTGGSGYTLALGAISGVGNGTSFTLNSTTANLSVASIALAGNSSTLFFTGSGNTTVVGSISNAATKTNGVAFSSTGSVTLSGAETLVTSGGFANSINSGTVVLNNSSAFLSAPTLGNTTASSTSAATLLLGGTDAAGLTGGITMSKAISVEDTTSGLLTLGGQNTSGVNTYSGVITLGATANTGKSVNLVAATGGEVDFTNTIVKNGTDTTAGITVNGTYTVGSATVTPTGNVKLTAINTFAGPTAISGGTLTLAGTTTLGSTSGITVASSSTLSLAAANALATPGATTSTTMGSPVSVAGQVPITLGGGTLLRNGTGVSLGSQSGTAGTVGIGALTLTAASTIDYGTTGVGTLNFNGISGLSSTDKLSIIDFTTTHPSAMGTDGTDDRFIVNQDLSSVLADITIDGITPTSEIMLGNGEFELSVTPVPEASTWMAGVLSFGVLGWRLRRRLTGAFERRSAV